MESGYEKYATVSGVHNAMGREAVQGECASCGHGRRLVYPWPMGGVFGKRCATCVVKESGGLDDA
jgi:hypothetical protein